MMIRLALDVRIPATLSECLAEIPPVPDFGKAPKPSLVPRVRITRMYSRQRKRFKDDILEVGLAVVVDALRERGHFRTGKKPRVEFRQRRLERGTNDEYVTVTGRV